jgi:hypothetical protein
MITRVSVDPDTVMDILKKSNNIVDDINLLLSAINKSVYDAEISGWNDHRYDLFKDNFDTGEKMLKDGVRHFEDVLIPDLKRILVSIEDFYK